MKRGMAFRTLTAKISAVAFSVFLGASMTVPAWAGVSVSTNVNTTSATSQDKDCQIIFVDENDNKIASFPAKTGDTYGPGADDKISVRSTYYDAKTGKDYDVVDNSYTGKVGSADIKIRYKEHQDQETGYYYLQSRYYSPLISRLECDEKMTSTFCTAIWVAQRPPREHRGEINRPTTA